MGPDPEWVPPTACASCEGPMGASYYLAGGSAICEMCQTVVGNGPGGTAMSRFGVAVVAGTLAGALGAGIYYGILALTGYELGLVAIVVGWLVGNAVNFGSRGRGGWIYQLTAVLITYLSITATYVPFVLEGMEKEGAVEGGMYIVAFVIALFAPFLSGFENIIGILIIGFALYEAWRRNKRVDIEVSGPYPVGEPPPQPSHG